MNVFQRFFVETCENDVGKLRQRILEKTGVAVEWSLVWKWCRTKRPRPIDPRYADLIESASDGAVSYRELTHPDLCALGFERVLGPRQKKTRRTAKSKKRRAA